MVIFNKRGIGHVVVAKRRAFYCKFGKELKQFVGSIIVHE